MKKFAVSFHVQTKDGSTISESHEVHFDTESPEQAKLLFWTNFPFFFDEASQLTMSLVDQVRILSATEVL